MYLFFDESGNLDFTPSGSRYFLFGVVSTPDPAPLTGALAGLRYELLRGGLELECFHAAHDTPPVRSRVFDTIVATGGFEVDLLVADKRRLLPELRDPFEFYACLAHALIDAVLRRHTGGDEPIVIVTDRLPLQRHRQAAEKAFKAAIRNTLAERPFCIVHHATAAHPLLQVTDYCTWAAQRLWQRGDARSYALVEPWVRGVLKMLGDEEDGGGAGTAEGEKATSPATLSGEATRLLVTGEEPFFEGRHRAGGEQGEQ